MPPEGCLPSRRSRPLWRRILWLRLRVRAAAHRRLGWTPWSVLFSMVVVVIYVLCSGQTHRLVNIHT